MSERDGSDASDAVDLSKPAASDPASDPAAGAADDPPFDPYRFGKPDHPVPPEFAPPGYVPDPPADVAPPDPYPYASVPYGRPPQHPYPDSPYAQQYAPPPPAGYRPQQGTNGKAVTALVLGIGSIVLCWLSLFAAIVIVPALVFGFLALSDAKRRDGNGRGMAIAGIACAIVGAVLAVLVTVVALDAYSDCGGQAQSSEPGFNDCVRDNLF